MWNQTPKEYSKGKESFARKEKQNQQHWMWVIFLTEPHLMKLSRIHYQIGVTLLSTTPVTCLRDHITFDISRSSLLFLSEVDWLPNKPVLLLKVMIWIPSFPKVLVRKSIWQTRFGLELSSPSCHPLRQDRQGYWYKTTFLYRFQSFVLKEIVSFLINLVFVNQPTSS